jgi:hypothetical protein
MSHNANHKHIILPRASIKGRENIRDSNNMSSYSHSYLGHRGELGAPQEPQPRQQHHPPLTQHHLPLGHHHMPLSQHLLLPSPPFYLLVSSDLTSYQGQSLFPPNHQSSCSGSSIGVDEWSGAGPGFNSVSFYDCC